jgi:pimeloyl-ACP methyl ester carboxylesterase
MNDVAEQTGANPGRFALFGYSGGAQFAHRYCLAYPDYITCLATCAAGYYTWPTMQMPFPYGLDCQGLPGKQQLRLDDFLAIPTLTTVGLRDTARDRSLRKNPELDVLQGRTRIERARRWVDALVTAAVARGLQPQHHFATIDHVGHDFRKAIFRGLAETVWPFLTASTISSITSSFTRTTTHADPRISE